MGHTEAMTEQEAEALAARLTRVWEPKSFAFDVNFVGRDYSSEFEYHAELESGVKLTVTFGSTWSYSHETYEVCRDDASLVSEDGDCYPITYTSFPTKREQSFASEWMLFFRSRCWLSGCAIEANAHEKAEWVQGFSCEEIEAWNLKF